MLFLPFQLGEASLTKDALREDRRHCRRFGPCGLGKKALYLNSFYIDRMYYVPVSSVKRIYKRIAMSRGGFTGKGVFASIPYLVVEYDKGAQKQCIFKREDEVDLLLAAFHESFPSVPVHSEAAEKRLQEKQAALLEKQKRLENAAAKDAIDDLERAAQFLEKRPALYEELSHAARQKRIQEKTNPAYRWVALAVFLMGAVSAAYGIYSLMQHQGSAMYFLLFGLAAIFLFSGANVLPTGKNNAKAVQQRLDDARLAMERYTGTRKNFPIPACYAHPGVLRWMEDILAREKAVDAKGALAVLKQELRSLNSSVTVEQETYDEIMAIKPLFLVMDYR